MASPLTLLQPSVATPYGPGQAPLRPIRIEAPLGEGISKFAEGLQNIFDIQQEHQQKLDFARADQQATDQLTQAMQQALYGGPPQQSIKTFKESAQKISDTMLKDPQNASIIPQLQIHLGELTSRFSNELAPKALNAIRDDQEQQTKNLAAKTAMQVAQGTTFDPATGKDVVSLDAQLAERKLMTNIDSVWNFQPGLAEKMKDEYRAHRDMQTATAIAQNDPTHIDDYLKSHPDFTPEQQGALINRATAAINLPMRQIDANQNAVRANLYNKFQDQAASHQLDMGALNNARRFNLITEGDYEHFAGQAYVAPPNRAVLTDAMAAIDQTNDPKALDYLSLSFSSDPNLRGGLSTLNKAISIKKSTLETVAGKAKIQAEEDLRRAYEKGGLEDMINDKINPGARENAARAALSDWRAATFNESDPAKIRKAAQDAIKNNPRPENPALKGKPLMVPPAADDETAKKATALGKKLGLIK